MPTFTFGAGDHAGAAHPSWRTCIRAWRWQATGEQAVFAASLFWALVANRPFIVGALGDRATADPATWAFAGAMLAMLFALHALLLLPLATRWTLKPVLATVIVVTACATFYADRFAVIVDPAMVRNVLHTDAAEAAELLTPALAWHLLMHAGLPLLLLWRLQLVRRAPLRALAVRAAALLGCVAVLSALGLATYQPLSTAMRNQRELRYLIAPANWMWSLGAVAAHEARGAARPRVPIGLDAVAGTPVAARPRVVVLVVGETARRANWQLSGYARDTTPQLAQRDLINFADVRACGTSTEVSVPCMFAPVGRRDYDEARIRGSESLLHLLARAGVDVFWRDNQSGCKGVCDGLPNDHVAQVAPALCEHGHCLDEGLLTGLAERIGRGSGTQFIVLHMLGNHGPAYFRRYPARVAAFAPACTDEDLRKCSQDEIVAAYDNALRYTDEVLARLVDLLAAQADRVDSAMLFVSDHGESLGEHGLYLHGLPYAIAPEEQTRVPMVMWSSPGFAQARQIDLGCLRSRAAQPASHDHLFHTLLGLLDVRTALYAPAFDLTAGCRG
ncbi:MAG: phosphoethanolamine--lipid A transferase, partial [Burkholderiaceae bacterium]|nr:phosphoethanolamine--lipid A transferase [Burkholderiaceae bacterium]